MNSLHQNLSPGFGRRQCGAEPNQRSQGGAGSQPGRRGPQKLTTGESAHITKLAGQIS